MASGQWTNHYQRRHRGRLNGAHVEKLTIQDASRRLNISQRDVREYIRNGELKAERDPDSEHGRWLVVMPEDGWQDKFKTYLDQLDASITRWWWANEKKSGLVHYPNWSGLLKTYSERAGDPL